MAELVRYDLIKGDPDWELKDSGRVVAIYPRSADPRRSPG